MWRPRASAARSRRTTSDANGTRVVVGRITHVPCRAAFVPSSPADDAVSRWMPRIVLSLPGTGEVAQPTTERRLFSCRSRANNNSRAPGSSNPGSERRLASRRASPPSDTAGASAPGQSSNSTPSGQHSMSFQGSRGKQQSTPEPTAGERSVTAALAHSDAPMAVVPSSGTPTAASQLGQTLSAHDGPAYASYPAQAGASQSLPLQLGMGPAFVSADLSALLSPDPPEEVLGPSGQVYRSTSLGCLRPHQQPRRFAIFVVRSPGTSHSPHSMPWHGAGHARTHMQCCALSLCMRHCSTIARQHVRAAVAHASCR